MKNTSGGNRKKIIEFILILVCIIGFILGGYFLQLNTILWFHISLALFIIPILILCIYYWKELIRMRLRELIIGVLAGVLFCLFFGLANSSTVTILLIEFAFNTVFIHYYNLKNNYQKSKFNTDLNELNSTLNAYNYKIIFDEKFYDLYIEKQKSTLSIFAYSFTALPTASYELLKEGKSIIYSICPFLEEWYTNLVNSGNNDIYVHFWFRTTFIFVLAIIYVIISYFFLSKVEIHKDITEKLEKYKNAWKNNTMEVEISEDRKVKIKKGKKKKQVKNETNSKGTKRVIDYSSEIIRNIDEMSGFIKCVEIKNDESTTYSNQSK